MVRRELVPSGFKSMWLFAMFDLPVDTKKARKQYTGFRKMLIQQGFCMLQYSVYARYCGSEESAEAYRQRVKAALPPEGDVRLLAVTERQFGKMESYIGKAVIETEKPPSQLMLF